MCGMTVKSLAVATSTDETDRVAHDPAADIPGHDLVDEAGRRWTTHWARWCDAKQVRQFLHREQDILIRSSTGGEVTRLSPEQARTWWREVHRCFEEPGKAAPSWSAEGLTWAVHIWHCDDGGEPSRLLVFETFC